MHPVALRDAAPADFDAICALNLADVQHTSAMDIGRLNLLDGLACFHKVGCIEGRVCAFLLAMCNDAQYDSSNFGWFSRRFPRFVYIDRIVVAPAARGSGLGTLLYEELFRFARHDGYPLVACEYNIVPPNEPSKQFHAKFGFIEQGTQWVGNGAKQVSLQTAKT